MNRDSALSRLNCYREGDRHECNLISHRMNWLVTCQSFLITAYAISANHSNFTFRMVFALCLSIIGFYVALKVGDSISQAHLVINDWHKREAELQAQIEQVPDALLKDELKSYFINRDWTGVDDKHVRSFAFQTNIYKCFIAAWITLLIVSVVLNGFIPALCGNYAVFSGLPLPK